MGPLKDSVDFLRRYLATAQLQQIAAIVPQMDRTSTYSCCKQFTIWSQFSLEHVYTRQGIEFY